MIAPGGQIIFLGSGTHRTERSPRMVPHPRWADPAVLARPGSGLDSSTLHAGQCAYATSKLAVNYLCNEMQRQLGESVRCNVYDPGMVAGTGLARGMGPIRRLMWERVMVNMPLPGASTAKRSSAAIADLALSRRFADLRGGYIDIDQVGSPSGESIDRDRERRLWEFLGEIAPTAPHGGFEGDLPNRY